MIVSVIKSAKLYAFLVIIIELVTLQYILLRWCAEHMASWQQKLSSITCSISSLGEMDFGNTASEFLGDKCELVLEFMDISHSNGRQSVDSGISYRYKCAF